MAWRSSGTTNASLIENLSANGLIKSARVKGAMLAVRPALPFSQQPRVTVTYR